jgi:hypothetical protein
VIPSSIAPARLLERATRKRNDLANKVHARRDAGEGAIKLSAGRTQHRLVRAA